MQFNQKIKIIYEDNHLLVIEKPVNISSQEDESKDPDVLTLLKEYIKQKYNKPGKVYLGLIHRLDRPAGGVMVFARTSKAASRLSEQIRRKEFKKVYMAVVHGKPGSSSGMLEHYLLKDNATNTVRVVPQVIKGAKQAVLEYMVLGAANGFSLVKIVLHTGRPHQIRVQFSTIMHPLFGDQRYGAGLNKPGQQLALWAAEVNCRHPTTLQEMIFRCTPPDTFPWNMFQQQLLVKIKSRSM